MTRLPEHPPDRPVQRLLTAGLLRWIDDETVELPYQVRQVLRGEAVFDPTSLAAPTVTGRKHKPADINAAAAGEALELVRHCEDVVKALGEVPALHCGQVVSVSANCGGSPRRPASTRTG